MMMMSHHHVGITNSAPATKMCQGRWTHNNVDSWLTWCQSVSLDWHFDVEQRARGFMRTFFGFNGTGGTWCIQCIEESGEGGWGRYAVHRGVR